MGTQGSSQSGPSIATGRDTGAPPPLPVRAGAASTGNSVRYFSDEGAALDAIWHAIDEARTRVWVEIYIMEPDEVGRETLRRLTAAARRGCDVILVFDRFGSRNLRPRHLRPLREAGGRALVFNPLRPWRGRQSPLFRNHRKVIIVDDRVAFCGGLNLSLAYSGVLSRKLLRRRKRHIEHLFDDTLIRMTGPCVADLGRLFTRTLHYADAIVERRPFSPMEAVQHPGMPVHVLAHDPAERPSSLEQALLQAVGAARNRCYLSSPYFVPTAELDRALRDAADRGLDVRVLTAGRTDVPFARFAARHGYGRFLERGVRIYEMYQRTLHSKTLCVDGRFAVVGSYNMDVWTSRHVLEIAAAVHDESVARACESEFHQHAGMSVEVSLEAWRGRSWWRRLLDRAIHYLAGLI
ncbi:MAG: phospholipase D-like domain-containing protein [Myxococcota bacterium]